MDLPGERYTQSLTHNKFEYSFLGLKNLLKSQNKTSWQKITAISNIYRASKWSSGELNPSILRTATMLLTITSLLIRVHPPQHVSPNSCWVCQERGEANMQQRSPSTILKFVSSNDLIFFLLALASFDR